MGPTGVADVTHPPVLIDSVNNKWVKVGNTGGYRRDKMDNIYRVQVRGKAGTGKTCCSPERVQYYPAVAIQCVYLSPGQLTIEAALSDPNFRKHALMVGSTGVAAAQIRRVPRIRSVVDSHVKRSWAPDVHGTTAATAFRLPVKGNKRRKLNETERTRVGWNIVVWYVLTRADAVSCRAAKALRDFLIKNEITTILIDEKSMIGQQDMGWRQHRMLGLYAMLPGSTSGSVASGRRATR